MRSCLSRMIGRRCLERDILTSFFSSCAPPEREGVACGLEITSVMDITRVDKTPAGQTARRFRMFITARRVHQISWQPGTMYESLHDFENARQGMPCSYWLCAADVTAARQA